MNESRSTGAFIKYSIMALAFMPSPLILQAHELSDGISAYQSRRYEQAFQIFSEHADIASPKALYYLSELYRSGKGVEPDEYSAFELCKQAAEEGIVEAQFRLGMMYLQGEGTTEDDDRALQWLWMAADNGYPHAREILDFVLNSDFTTGC